MRRALLVGGLLLFVLSACSAAGGGGIDVIDVGGPLDAGALTFMADSIEGAAEEGQELAVLQIDSQAVLDEAGYQRLEALTLNPPLPLAVWVGPAPASAFGGAGLLAWDVAESAIAPGSSIAPFEPVVLNPGSPTMGTPLTAEDSGLELQATIRQYIQDLDGRVFQTSSGPVTVSTIEDFEGGVTVKTVTFREPGLATRFFRLAGTPEAAFFFLVVGLTVVTFEFFALGPAVAASAAAGSLLLAGWGIVTLPVRWWAVALAVGSWAVITAAYQKGGIHVMTLVGAVGLQIAGMYYVDGAGQLDPRWLLVLPSVLAVLFFFLIAMPTVQRARLSTPTIGRESLVGHRGRALDAFQPEGVVEIDGARWRATAHREAGIVSGSEIVVTGVDGLYLEIEPSEADRET